MRPRVLNVLCIVGAVFAVGTIVSVGAWLRQGKPSVPAYVPTFKTNDCFVRNGIRETWESQADGKVIMVGVMKYLLMDQSEADRKAGGTKVGYYETIERFDAGHRKVLCPEKWITRK